ncbi:hypothetical protein [Streptomyces sp. NRRL S-1022]|uniref:hypothetical protein n=1 Tax=Streptomyces sp. NRRL S-1022 TaxID=1463880 RepID=UPI00131AD046|nr:hypothetical protein [Streptomyces sp. NRRL S-1022]
MADVRAAERSLTPSLLMLIAERQGTTGADPLLSSKQRALQDQTSRAPASRRFEPQCTPAWPGHGARVRCGILSLPASTQVRAVLQAQSLHSN